MDDKTNIILINCNDLGYGDLGCYGSTRNNTPHLNRLAAEAMQRTAGSRSAMSDRRRRRLWSLR